MGGNPRVGLEDNLYLERGKLATNAQLVEKAIRIVNDLGVSTMTETQSKSLGYFFTARSYGTKSTRGFYGSDK